MAFIEAQGEEKVAKFALAIGALGNVRTETMRAFGEEEYRRIVPGCPEE